MSEEAAPDIDPSDGGRELPPEPIAAVATVLTKLQKWGDYQAMGDVVPPTKFVPMKTPLSNEIISHWSTPEGPKHRLTVMDLLTRAEQAGRKIGMILDLSNHDCLYTSDIPEGLHYEHIKLVAKELPPPAFVQEVCERANAFWARCPDLYIAIHCAYGFNRTGFVLCSYLITQLGFSVDQALDAFKTARPPGVKHLDFRNELRARYEPSPSRALLPEPQQLSVSFSSTVTAMGEPTSMHTPGASRPAPSQGSQGSAGQGDSSGHPQVGSEGAQQGLHMHTPQGQILSHATPVSENDSLGANDRFILQGLRAHGLLSSGRALTPSHLEDLLTAAAARTPAGGSSPVPVSLGRKSVSEIEWSVDASDDSLSALSRSNTGQTHNLAEDLKVAAAAVHSSTGSSGEASGQGATSSSQLSSRLGNMKL